MGTKDITGHKVIAADQHLYFAGGTAFYIHQADGGEPPSLDVFGTVTDQGTTGSVFGVVTDSASSLVTVNIHDGGAISAFTNGGAAFGISAHCPIIFVNDGTLYAADNRLGAVAFYAPASEADITNGGLVKVEVGNGNAEGFSLGDASLINSGTVEINGKSAQGVFASGLLDFTNTGSFDIKGGSAGAFGLHVGGTGTQIDNQGDIAVTASAGTDRFGIEIAGGDSLSIDNSGTIRAAFAIIEDDGVSADVTIVNSGKLAGGVALGAGDDRIDNSGAITRPVHLGDGADVFVTSGHGHVKGGVFGGAGDDVLTGGKTADQLNGAIGSDHLTGGAGADVLTGGANADVFVFRKVTDSTAAHADLITDLEGSDHIDLSAIDADTTTSGRQAFVLVSALDGHAGQLALSFDADTDTTTIAGDVDGDGVADLVIHAAGDQSGFAGFVL